MGMQAGESRNVAVDVGPELKRRVDLALVLTDETLRHVVMFLLEEWSRPILCKADVIPEAEWRVEGGKDEHTN